MPQIYFTKDNCLSMEWILNLRIKELLKEEGRIKDKVMQDALVLYKKITGRDYFFLNHVIKNGETGEGFSLNTNTGEIGEIDKGNLKYYPGTAVEGTDEFGNMVTYFE